MKAIRANSLASLEAYTEVDVPIPEPLSHEVRIKVSACGVGYVDALLALGRYQVKPPLPYVPGVEVSGWVDAVGSDVTDLAVGDRVVGQVRGGFSEFAIADAASVRGLPPNMTLVQAAGFRVNYLTALHALRDRARLAPGESLLVFGASGGVGTAALQLGCLLGARSIAVASTPEKRAFAQRCGADAALDREADGWRDRLRRVAPAGIDVIFDPVCGPLFEPAFRSLKWRGRHLVVGFVGGNIPALPANLPLIKGAALIGVDFRQFASEFEIDRAQHEFDELLTWVATGRLTPPSGRVFPFDEGRQAMAYALSGKGVAKTVLSIDAE